MFGIPTLLLLSASLSPAADDAEKRIAATIHEAFEKGETYNNVPDPDGRMLRLLTEAVNAKNVVEIGTSTGVSGMWFAMALRKTGGRLHTFELDARRAATARAHFKQAGMQDLIELTEGDAHRNLATVKGPVDVVFIDAEKPGYIDYLNKALPLVRPGGLILAHNVEMVPDYMRAAQSNPALETLVFSGGAGLAISLKKR